MLPQTDDAAAGGATSERLRRDLRDRIVRLELAPGARLSEWAISAEYGCSRQPVREAFIILAYEGLLEVRPQRGTFVRLLSEQRIRAMRFARESIEAGLARRAAHAGRDLRAKAAEAMRRAIAVQRAAPDEAAFLAADRAMHRELARVLDATHAWPPCAVAKSQTDRVRFIAGRPDPRAEALAEHEALADALAAGDAEAAERTARAHLRRILPLLPLARAARPDWFEHGEDGPGIDRIAAAL
ncbi:GntR family transcriptional regulator [Oceanicella actignis]|uniref:DNA-binding transcriptional regulator, GntR family n=1 Tax=Oceanicella actignis TaxID=1189325 RepID=A0A1M7RZ32_9RHOB|nr:GntR family transcriptional regulator [Oceanicella actignis]SES95904.1 DNA-binding transcriptional regulator, GntR family [Oceanicella actignis]SHN51451.1 DNA-binding transcriptional regulator, GntR family [Oceanicella actignis]